MIEVSPVMIGVLVGLALVMTILAVFAWVELWRAWAAADSLRTLNRQLSSTIDDYRYNTAIAVEAYDAGDPAKLAEFIDAHRRGKPRPDNAPTWFVRGSGPRPKGTAFVLIRGGRRGGDGSPAA